MEQVLHNSDHNVAYSRPFLIPLQLCHQLLFLKKLGFLQNLLQVFIFFLSFMTPPVFEQHTLPCTRLICRAFSEGVPLCQEPWVDTYV